MSVVRALFIMKRQDTFIQEQIDTEPFILMLTILLPGKKVGKQELENLTL